MKKITFCLFFVLAAFTSDANILIINNHTGCTVSISTIIGDFDIPPTTLGSPMIVNSTSTDDFIIGKIYSYSAPYFELIVGLQPMYSGYATSSILLPCSPSPLSAIWSQASSTADAYLTIF